MKKKLLFTLLPLLLAAGCTAPSCTAPRSIGILDAGFVPYRENRNGLTTMVRAETSHVTYLMLSVYGYINDGGVHVKGDITEKFYQNTVAWVAEAGSALPDASLVKSEVEGATFMGWAYYDDDSDIYPTYYTSVPSKNELALKAIFDGTSTSGGGGQSSSTVTFSCTNVPDWIPNDGAKVFAWAWGGGADDGEWFNCEINGTTITFVAPDDITGFLLARCDSATTVPSWSVTGGNPGRIYNQTENIDVSYGTTSYVCSSWKEYNPN